MYLYFDDLIKMENKHFVLLPKFCVFFWFIFQEFQHLPKSARPKNFDIFLITSKSSFPSKLAKIPT